MTREFLSQDDADVECCRLDEYRETASSSRSIAHEKPTYQEKSQRVAGLVLYAKPTIPADSQLSLERPVTISWVPPSSGRRAGKYLDKGRRLNYKPLELSD